MGASALRGGGGPPGVRAAGLTGMFHTTAVSQSACFVARGNWGWSAGAEKHRQRGRGPASRLRDGVATLRSGKAWREPTAGCGLVLSDACGTKPRRNGDTVKGYGAVKKRRNLNSTVAIG